MTIDEIENMLLVISERSNDEKNAKAAFTDLYRGYSSFLSAVVSRTLQSSGIYDEHIMQTVINNTFFKLYENPLIFTFPENVENDKPFKAWLSVVAKNELKRLLQEYYQTSDLPETLNIESAIISEDIPSEIFESVNIKVLNDALNTLSPRDKHILLTLYLYYEEGKNTPSNVLDLLCKMYETTKVNIRKIRERSEKKIINYFEKNTQLKPLKNVK
ncbi:sigma-70 family RNA polymerase sigma factor [Weeksellaceae bacterium A-14]